MKNKAAWIVTPKQRPLKVDDAPMPVLGPQDIIIRNHAIAINPVDWAIQKMGIIVDKYPCIVGCDLAGQVAAVGSDVKNYRIGDRVLSLPKFTAPNTSTGGSFQLFVACSEPLIAKIPDSVSYAEACVLPLCLSTAAVGLFDKDTLALPFPQIHPKPTGKVVLVWGGGSSVGSCAIQLLVAAGLEVAATASAHNLEYLKGLGAKYVFDHKSASVVEDIVGALEGKMFAGAFNAVMPPDTFVKCGRIASRLGGRKHVATVLPPKHPSWPPLDTLPKDVEFSSNWGDSLKNTEVGKAVWTDWLPIALENGSMLCKPEPVVVGQGLESLQEAVDRRGEGVSAQKVVVELP